MKATVKAFEPLADAGDYDRAHIQGIEQVAWVGASSDGTVDD
jgi:hypothetical protein